MSGIFTAHLSTTGDINKIIKPLDINKATEPDGISAKYVKMSANVIDCHLSNFIASDTSDNNYLKNPKQLPSGQSLKKIIGQLSKITYL